MVCLTVEKIYEISPIAESFSNLPDVVPEPAIPPRNHETSHMHDYYGDHHDDYSEFRPKIASTRNCLVKLFFKGNSDPSHFMIEINDGKSRIRHRTTLN